METGVNGDHGIHAARPAGMEHNEEPGPAITLHLTTGETAVLLDQQRLEVATLIAVSNEWNIQLNTTLVL